LITTYPISGEKLIFFSVGTYDINFGVKKISGQIKRSVEANGRKIFLNHKLLSRK